MAGQRARKTGLVWGVVGGMVLLAGIAVVVVTGVASQPQREPSAGTTAPQAGDPSGSASPGVAPAGGVVDPAALDSGWVPEPLTTNAEVYLRAAIAAAGTADTALSTRDDWLTYLDSWFTPDPRFTNPTDQAAQTARYQKTMREAVVFPEQLWQSLEGQGGRVVAATVGEMTMSPVPDYDGEDMVIGTSDVVLTFTESGGEGGEHSYQEQVRISAQVLCGDASVPTPGTAQTAGDCKLIRYFDSALGD